MEHLQSLRESINLPSHFILQVSHADDVLKDLVLLVLEVLVESLDVRKTVLDLDINLAHSLVEGVVLCLNLTNRHIHEFCGGLSCISVRPTTNWLHKLHPVELRLELVAHVLDCQLDLFDLLLHLLGVGCRGFVDF